MSLAQLIPALSAAMGQPVSFAADCVGPVAAASVAAMGQGRSCFWKTPAFMPARKRNDPDFTAALAANGDIFCNDAFFGRAPRPCLDRGLARHLPACAGLLMAEELAALDAALGNPVRPVVAIVGGAKVSTKLDLWATSSPRSTCW